MYPALHTAVLTCTTARPHTHPYTTPIILAFPSRHGGRSTFQAAQSQSAPPYLFQNPTHHPRGGQSLRQLELDAGLELRVPSWGVLVIRGRIARLGPGDLSGGSLARVGSALPTPRLPVALLLGPPLPILASPARVSLLLSRGTLPLPLCIERPAGMPDFRHPLTCMLRASNLVLLAASSLLIEFHPLPIPRK